MKIISMVRAICLIPIFFTYGAWMPFCLSLRVAFLVVAIWLICSLLGKVGDCLLAMYVIYCLSCLLPNPNIVAIGKIRLCKDKRPFKTKGNLTNKVVDFNAHRQRVTH